MSTQKRPGPTGDYPRGKLNPDDMGGLNVAVGSDDKGHVAVNFATPVIWIMMTAAEARSFAANLLKQADKADAALRGN